MYLPVSKLVWHSAPVEVRTRSKPACGVDPAKKSAAETEVAVAATSAIVAITFFILFSLSFVLALLLCLYI
jgi:hypothetical protein